MSIERAHIDPRLEEALRVVMDPELPTVSIIGLGIIREARLVSDVSVSVVMTPTYSGCPALEVMRSEVEQVLRDRGYSSVSIRYQYDPPWSSDWIDEETRLALKHGGVAPPALAGEELVQIGKRSVACPFCDSLDTELRSEFGSTACKSMFFCSGCLQPFELFKTTR